jgi:hypothetical protein
MVLGGGSSGISENAGPLRSGKNVNIIKVIPSKKFKGAWEAPGLESAFAPGYERESSQPRTRAIRPPAKRSSPLPAPFFESSCLPERN